MRFSIILKSINGALRPQVCKEGVKLTAPSGASGLRQDHTRARVSARRCPVFVSHVQAVLVTAAPGQHRH